MHDDEHITDHLLVIMNKSNWLLIILGYVLSSAIRHDSAMTTP